MTDALDRADLVRRLLGYMDTGTTYTAPGLHLVPPAFHTDPERFQTEVDVIFRRSPLWLAWTAELPGQGSVKSTEIAGVPLLLIRGQDGVLRGFRNTCGHRAACLVRDRYLEDARRITCPYHAWTYNLEGALVGVPERECFAGLADEDRGLERITVQEKYGLVVGCIDPTVPWEIDDYLAGLGPQLEGLGWDRFVFAGSETIEAKANWKLAMDTYGESYHFPYLHRESLPTAIGNVIELDFYGPHIRQAFPFGPIHDLRNGSEKELNAAVIGLHLFVVYVLFPNVVLVTTDMGVSAQQILPGATVGTVTATDHRILAPGIAEEIATMTRQGLEQNFTIVDTEDFPTSESIFASLSSGTERAMMYGRNEAAIHHFHASVDKAISSHTTGSLGHLGR